MQYKIPPDDRQSRIHGFRRRSATRRKNPAANARPIAYNEDEARPPRRRHHASRELSMTDHTTPTPEPPADPNRDPEDDPLSSPPGHHHDNPQQPDGPPSKDPV
ncbi:hypothetical protein [Burkholderia pyrrocinia]|nr:hypothetical protein [Burkholderia pyrrocinia]